MIFLPQILAAIAGVLIYISLYDYVPEYLKINIKHNKFFPIFIIITLFSGLMIAQTIHYNSVIAQNSNAERILSINWCFIEDAVTCSNNVNTLNNVNYNTAVSSGKYPAQLFLAASIPDLLQKNAFSYFCAGILLAWGAVFVGGLRHERSD